MLLSNTDRWGSCWRIRREKDRFYVGIAYRAACLSAYLEDCNVFIEVDLDLI